MRLRGRGDSGAPGDRVLVELVEADDDDAAMVDGLRGAGAPGPLGDTAEPAGAPPRRRRRPLWWVGAAVLVVLAMVVTVANVAESRRAADRRAVLAALPWVLPTMDAPLEEVWRVPGDQAFTGVPGMVLVSGGGHAMTAVDAGTGAVLWSVGDAAQQYCYLVTGADDRAGTASETSGEVMCQSYSVEDPGGLAVEATSVVDVQTGEELVSVSGESQLALSQVVDGDWLSMSTLDDGTVILRRMDPRTGEVRWTFRSEPGVVDEVSSSDGRLVVSDDIVLFDGGRDLAVSLATGEEVTVDAATVPDSTFTLPDGGTVEWFSRFGGRAGGGRVVDGDGALRFEFDGWPLQSPFTDGSDRQVLALMQLDGDGTAAGTSGIWVGLDTATGAELWRGTKDDAGTPLMTLDGRSLAESAADAIMADVRTGEEVWRHPVDASIWLSGPVTDGAVALLPVRDGRDLRVMALDLRTGEERWSMPAPQGLTGLTASPDGLVLMATANEVIAYRP